MCGSLPSPNSSRSNRANARQRGVILIAVLLTVALVAGLGIKFAGQYQLGLARAESRWHGLQARAFLEGTEEVAKLLFSTADIEPDTDFLGEPWGNEVPIEDEGVTGVAKLTDASSRFNLNDIEEQFVADKPVGTSERYTESQRFFIRLLQTFPDVQLGQQEAEALLAAIVDWKDPDDNESEMGGAESNYYQGLADPYMAANALFKSVEELRLIRGFNENPLLVNRLLPFVTVLPEGNVGINVNTLEAVSIPEGTPPPEPGELAGNQANNLARAIGPATRLDPMSDSDAIQFLMERPEVGFAAEEIKTALDKIFNGEPGDTSILKAKTNYFWLNASVQMVDQRRNMRSLMKRGDNGTLTVIQREDVYELPTVARPDEDEEDEK